MGEIILSKIEARLSLYKIIQILLSLISPMFGFISALIFSFGNNISAFAIALSLSVIVIYFPVLYDVSASFFANVDYLNGNILFPLHSINGFASYFPNLDYYYVVFFFVFISFYIWFNKCEALSRASGKYIGLYFFALFLSLISYKESMDLFRSYFAYMLCLQGVWLYLQDKKWSFLFVLLASVVHYSSIVILIAMLCTKLFRIDRVRLSILIVGSLFIGLNFDSLIEYMNHIIPVRGSVLSTYIYSEKWGIRREIGIGAVVLMFTQVSLLLSALLIAIDDINAKKTKVFLFTICCFFVFIKFRVFGERFFLLSTVMIPIVFLYRENTMIHLKEKVLLLFSGVKFLIYNFFVFGYFFSSSFNYVISDSSMRSEFMLKPIYVPTLYLLDIGSNGYSNEVIESNSAWRKDQYNNRLTGKE